MSPAGKKHTAKTEKVYVKKTLAIVKIFKADAHQIVRPRTVELTKTCKPFFSHILGPTLFFDAEFTEIYAGTWGICNREFSDHKLVVNEYSFRGLIL